MMDRRSVALVFVAIASLLVTGCVVSASSGYRHRHVEPVPPPHVRPAPPPHAKAYGYRAKHHYRYYPDSHVYFDTGNNLYFYLDSNGWQMSTVLPTRLRVSLGSSVMIELAESRPYVHFEEHKVKYPGKKNKKKEKENRKKKNRYDY